MEQKIPNFSTDFVMDMLAGAPAKVPRAVVAGCIPILPEYPHWAVMAVLHSPPVIFAIYSSLVTDLLQVAGNEGDGGRFYDFYLSPLVTTRHQKPLLGAFSCIFLEKMVF